MINILIAATVAVSPALEVKAELAFTMAACSDYYTPSDRIIYASVIKPNDERERGFMAAAFDAGAKLRQEEGSPTLQYCRQRISELVRAYNGY